MRCYIIFSFVFLLIFFSTTQCLKRVKRVIGGREVKEGNWPWLVHVNAKIPTQTFWGIPIKYLSIDCTGSLVGRQWVLTAAHCIAMKDRESNLHNQLIPKYWHAKLGDIESQNSFSDRVQNVINRVADDFVFQSYYIHASKIVLHPDFDPENPTQHDLALLKLEKTLDAEYITIKEEEEEEEETVEEKEEEFEDDSFLGKFIDMTTDTLEEVGNKIITIKKQITGEIVPEKKIALIKLANSSVGDMDDGTADCVVKGWGCQRKNGPASLIAREKEIFIKPFSLCQSFWPDLDSSNYFCTKGEPGVHVGICPGDSGGPLVCKMGDEWVQMGVASFSNLDSSNIPSVFTRIPHYEKWIQDAMKEE